MSKKCAHPDCNNLLVNLATHPHSLYCNDLCASDNNKRLVHERTHTNAEKARRYDALMALEGNQLEQLEAFRIQPIVIPERRPYKNARKPTGDKPFKFIVS